MRTGPVKLLWGVAFVIGASAALRAQDVVPVMDNRQACQILSSAVPAIYAYSSNTDSDDVNRAYLTPTGIKLGYEAKKGRPETGRSIDFSTITSVQVKEAGLLLVDISDPPGTNLYLHIVVFIAFNRFFLHTFAFFPPKKFSLKLSLLKNKNYLEFLLDLLESFETDLFLFFFSFSTESRVFLFLFLNSLFFL